MKEEKVYGVIGGVHLLETGEKLTKTKINEQIPIHEVGVELRLEIQ